MVYISNRVKFYAVNPLIYPETEKIPNLVAIALIPKRKLMRRSAEIKREFFDKPDEMFDNLSNAVAWAHTLLAKLKDPLRSNNPYPKQN